METDITLKARGGKHPVSHIRGLAATGALAGQEDSS